VSDLLHEHLVIFFPDQQLSIAGHLRLGSALGEVVENSYTPGADLSYPGVTVHRSEDGYVADVWHSDGQPRPAPVKYTIFKMITAPSRGGDTMWINQYRVYEQLSQPMRDLLDGLTALQRSLVNPNEQSTHPAVLEHPVTGRKLLYVSKAHTVRFLELSLGESRALIDYLVDVAVQPEYVCRYRWSPDAVGIWDNLATVHYGVNDFDEAAPLTIVIDDLAYAGAQHKVLLAPAGTKDSSASVTLQLDRSFGWYDLRLQLQDAPRFERRYAGRVETGKEGFSDPYMGRGPL
jgi:taurine dioxygenase